MDAAGSVRWVLPVAWCAVTALIIASGLVVPMTGGPGEAGFGYVFVVAGHGPDFMNGLALYSGAAAVLGVGFMFMPKMRNWRFNKGLAWSTFMLMTIGGALMLAAPQALLALAAGSGERATSLAQAWSVAWMQAGARISVAGVLVAIATFVDAWLRRRKT